MNAVLLVCLALLIVHHTLIGFKEFNELHTFVEHRLVQVGGSKSWARTIMVITILIIAVPILCAGMVYYSVILWLLYCNVHPLI